MKNGVAKLFRQIQRFVQINITGFSDRVVAIFVSINRIIKTYFNKTIGRAENSEKIQEQAIIEMQEELIQLHQAVARASATQKRIHLLHLQYNRVQSKANSGQQWHQFTQV